MSYYTSFVSLGGKQDSAINLSSNILTSQYLVFTTTTILIQPSVKNSGLSTQEV